MQKAGLMPRRDAGGKPEALDSNSIQEERKQMRNEPKFEWSQ